MGNLENKAAVKFLYESSILCCKSLNGGQVPKKKVRELLHGYIESLLWNNKSIPKTGLSFLESEGPYRLSLNIYVYNSRIPDGSFAVLFVQQDDVILLVGF